MTTEELKPGQKFPTPTPGFGDRVFYETLLRQRPDSVMAQEWFVLSSLVGLNCAQRYCFVVVVVVVTMLLADQYKDPLYFFFFARCTHCVVFVGTREP